MKKISVLLCSACLCFSLLGAASAAEPVSVEKSVSAGQSEQVVLTDPSVRIKNLSDFYLLKGSTYDKVTGLLTNLPSSQTGLTGDYYFRVDKNIVGDYFYHVKAYDTASHVLMGNYFVAKDSSCAWRLQEGQDAVMIYGSAAKLLDKAEIVVYPKKIPLGSYGIIRVHVPGMVPYDVKVTSLDPDVVRISDKMNIHPQQAGKTDLVIDLKVGDTVKTVTKTVTVVDESDKKVSRPSSHSGPGVSVGVGMGWGGGWHHHGGGIGIGVGPWW